MLRCLVVLLPVLLVLLMGAPVQGMLLWLRLVLRSMATRNESCSRASPMMKRCLLLVCLVYQLALLLLRFRLFVGGVINLIIPVWIRQRHGCEPALLEL